MCRQQGHDRRRCPCTATEATRLRDAFNRERMEERRQRRRELASSEERQRELNERQQQQPPIDPLQRLMQQQMQQMQELEQRQLEIEQYREEPWIERQRRFEVLTGNGPMRPPTGPTVRERKIQEILFENAEQIPNGLYKELMDALVIRD